MPELRRITPDLDDEMADVVLAMKTAGAMTAKLLQKREEGRGGWHRPDECSVEELKHACYEHLLAALKGDRSQWIDVVNFAAMLHVRTEEDA